MTTDPQRDSTTSNSLPSDAPLRYACDCGHRAEYARATNADLLHFHDACNQYTADCPACEIARPAQVLEGNFTGQTLVCVVAGEFTDDPEKPASGQAYYWDSFAAEFDADLPSPIEMVDGAYIIRCESCDALLDEDDKRADDGAPEVGWEYYACPQCDANTRADIAEYTYDSR